MVCLLRGGVSGLGGGACVSGPGVCAWSGGVCSQGVPGPGGFCVCSGGCLPQCLVRYHHPAVNRMTNRCKNMIKRNNTRDLKLRKWIITED